MEDGIFNGHYLYAPEVIGFVSLSNEYCKLVEDLSKYTPDEFIRRSLGLLSGIYAKAMEIDRPEPVSEEGNEKFVTEQDWAGIYHGIARILGPHNQYLRIVTEEEYDRSDLVTHTISEDLSDIYQELRDFTELYSRGLEDAMNDSLWEVLENFEEHWGGKLLNALSALHQLFIRDVDFHGRHDGEGDPGFDAGPYQNPLFDRFRDQSGEEE